MTPDPFDREVFVQACDSAFGAQGLALLRSLEDHATDVDWKMVWLCLDDELFHFLHGLDLGPDVLLVRHDALRWEGEHQIPGLETALAHREGGPWFWTWAAQATWWAAQRFPDARVTYLDSDLWFFSSPRAILRGLDENHAEVGIFTHRFPPRYADRMERGAYNVGWVTFDASDRARACLAWWAAKVREICLVDMPALKEQLPDGTWWERAAGGAGDQPWLEAFARIAKTRCLDLDVPGAAIAPYNLEAYEISRLAMHVESTGPTGPRRSVVTRPWARLLVFRGTTPDPDAITANNGPLVFFHFHEARFERSGRMIARTGYDLRGRVIDVCYEPYEQAVAAAAAELWGGEA